MSAGAGNRLTALPAEPLTPDAAATEQRLVSGRTIVLGALALLAVLLLAVTVGGGRPSSAADALPQAGPLVDRGLPVVRLADRIAALGTVGALLFAAVLRPGAAGMLPASSRRAVVAASRWALAWAATTLLGALLTISRLLGVSPGSVPVSTIGTFVDDLAAGRATVVVLVVAGVLALTARRCRHVVAARLLLALALSGLVVPAVLTGHSAAAENHAVAVTTLAVHVVAAAVWVGGLLALVLHGRDREDLAPASARFSTVALACFAATGASGVLAAVIVLGGLASVAGALGTGYGWLLVGKTGALIALGAFGWSHRRRTLPRVRAGLPGSFRRLAAVEVAVLLATVALAVALAGSPPPPASGTTAGPGAVEREVDPPPAEDMSGHDHGELSVGVLVDENRFHVSGPVSPGSRVTVHNRSTTEVTITATGGAFDVVVPGLTLLTFEAPDEPGSYPFTSRHSRAFGDVLVVG